MGRKIKTHRINLFSSYIYFLNCHARQKGHLFYDNEPLYHRLAIWLFISLCGRFSLLLFWVFLHFTILIPTNLAMYGFIVVHLYNSLMLQITMLILFEIQRRKTNKQETLSK